MTFDYVDVLGLALVLLGLVSLIRRGTATGRMREIFTGRRDTPASKQRLEELMAQEYRDEEDRRAKLWEEAGSSVRAARKLQQAIEGELEAINGIKQYMIEHRPDDKEGMQDIDLRRREIEQELERATGLIRTLRA